MQLLTVLYNLAVGCWLGGAALFTFVLTPKLFGVFSRDLAGTIVGQLFPGYFRWGLACGTVAVLCQLVNRGRFAIATLAILSAMLLLTSVQAFVIEPRAADLKQAIVSFETTPKDDSRRVQFRTLHGISMAANLAVVAGGVLLVILASLPLTGATPRPTGNGKSVEQRTQP